MRHRERISRLTKRQMRFLYTEKKENKKNLLRNVGKNKIIFKKEIKHSGNFRNQVKDFFCITGMIKSG